MDDAELMVKKEMELRARILGMYVVGVSRSRDRRRRRPTLTPPLSPPPPARTPHSYKKKREDFETDAAYDDYLEMVEDIS